MDLGAIEEAKNQEAASAEAPFELNKEFENDYMSLWILIRTDLQMTKGKICAQTAHAVLSVYKDLSNPADFQPKNEQEDDQEAGDAILLA